LNEKITICDKTYFQSEGERKIKVRVLEQAVLSDGFATSV